MSEENEQRVRENMFREKRIKNSSLLFKTYFSPSVISRNSKEVRALDLNIQNLCIWQERAYDIESHELGGSAPESESKWGYFFLNFFNIANFFLNRHSLFTSKPFTKW